MAWKRREREPPPPTPLDEVLSVSSLESSPWVQRRIKELKLKGRLVKGWTPPLVFFSCCADGTVQVTRD